MKPQKNEKFYDDLLAIARRAKNGDQFISLYDNGDLTPYNNDPSSADLALCIKLEFYYNGNFDDINFMYKKSNLYNEKWEDEEYRSNTISKAISLCGGTFYRGVGRPKVENKQKKQITFDKFLEFLTEEGIILRYNSIKRIDEIDSKYNEHSQERIRELLPGIILDKLKLVYSNCTKNIIIDYICRVADMNRFNPVLELLSSQKWDGQDRLSELYSILNIQKEDTLSRVLIHKWLWQGLSMLRNKILGAYGADGMLVFVGAQGIGKTAVAQKMAINDDWCYLGKEINFMDKDTTRRCTSAWIVELGEIETIFRGVIGLIKAFITSSTDLYRLPYRRNDIHLPRNTNLIGSCNDQKYLVDKTGNRRFWTIPIGTIDLDALDKLDTLQLYLQVDQCAKLDIQGIDKS